MFGFDAKIVDVYMPVKSFSLNVVRGNPIFDRGIPAIKMAALNREPPFLYILIKKIIH